MSVSPDQGGGFKTVIIGPGEPLPSTRALAGSLPLMVLAPDGQMAGFARVVTDYAVFAYLRDVFTRLPSMKITEIEQLTPENWLAAQKANAA